MKWGEWILQCLGIFQGDCYLEEIENKFGVEVLDSDLDMLEFIKIASQEKHPRLGDMIAAELFQAIIEKATVILENVKEEDFHYDCGGPRDTQLYCKGKIVSCWEDIEEIYK